jgi:sulfur-carrier protein adenylyltransferase/sulfurtransferase
MPEVLLESDLVLVATGSWQADGELNRWHIDQGRTVPILYGWAESHAAAGHAVVVAREGGCLRCGVGPTGVPIFQATQWPDGATQEEPACGNHFQPSGAIELSFVSNMIANAALQVLLSRPSESQHQLWLSSGARLKDNGGKWTESAQSLLGDAPHGFITERPWPATECGACRATALRDTANLGRRQNAAG